MIKCGCWAVMCEPVTGGWSGLDKASTRWTGLPSCIIPYSLPYIFVSARLEPYDGRPCLYLYEVMVAPHFQRVGLGTHLMRLVEEMVSWKHMARTSDQH